MARWSVRSDVRREDAGALAGNYWLLLCLVIMILLGFNLALADPITAVLHARWCPDLTAPQPQWQCVTSGTVAGGVEFHLVVNYEAPVVGVNCEYIKAIEQDSGVHQPSNNPPDTVEGPVSSTSYVVINSDGSINPQYLAACSDAPTSYRTATIFSTMPIQTFKCHNAQYIVKAKYSYVRVVPPPPGGPPMPRYETVSPPEIQITVNFNNLTVHSAPKMLRWDPDVPANNDTTFSFTLDSTQKKKCRVTINIYNAGASVSTSDALVYQKVYDGEEKLLCPGTHSFTWDGTINQQGYPPGGTAPQGLYTYDIIVEGACPYDTDRMRSGYLTVERAVDEQGNPIFEVQYYGYDDKETPDDESDDEYLYLIRWYVLKDSGNRNASAGKIWLYDPDLILVGEWDVAGLQCVQHNGETDGLRASSTGETHGVIVRVPVSLIEQKIGVFRFVLHVKDDHADAYKNHQVKPALELNSKADIRRVLVVLIDDDVYDAFLNWSDWEEICRRIEQTFWGYTCYENWGDGCGDNWWIDTSYFNWGGLRIPTFCAVVSLIPTEGALSAYKVPEGIKAEINQALQRLGSDWHLTLKPFVVTVRRVDGAMRAYGYFSTLSGKGTLDDPRGIGLLLSWYEYGAWEPEGWSREQALWGLTNIIIHELTHAITWKNWFINLIRRIFHIGIYEHDPTVPRCVFEKNFDPGFMLAPIRNRILPYGDVPWHSLNEVVDIRKCMRWKPW